jgi:hypothetical protein
MEGDSPSQLWWNCQVPVHKPPSPHPHLHPLPPTFPSLLLTWVWQWGYNGRNYYFGPWPPPGYTRINGPLFPTPPSQGFYPLPYPAPERNVPRWNYTKADLEKSQKSGPGFEKYVSLGVTALRLVAMFHGVGSW